MSAYYLLGYSSTNPTQGRPIPPHQGPREARQTIRSRHAAATTPIAISSTRRATDRETQLKDQLFSAVSATDLPVLVTAGWYRLSADKYYVPVAVAVPGYAIPVRETGQGQGIARRARDGRAMSKDVPVGRFSET